MCTIKEFVAELEEQDRIQIIHDNLVWRKNGSIGDSVVRRHAEAMNQKLFSGHCPIVRCMEYLVTGVFEFYAMKYLEQNGHF